MKKFEARRNIAYEKAFEFAKKIIKLAKQLKLNHKEFSLSDQILRSGTSIGANIKESIFAQSKSDFISKLSIALKEAAETEYWLELLKSEYNDKYGFDELIEEVKEIILILAKSVKTAKG